MKSLRYNAKIKPNQGQGDTFLDTKIDTKPIYPISKGFKDVSWSFFFCFNVDTARTSGVFLSLMVKN